MVHNQTVTYLTGWVDQNLLKQICAEQMKKAGLVVHDLPDYLRVRQRGNMLVFTNYGSSPARIPQSFTGGLLLGDRLVPPAGVTILSVAS